MTIFYFGYGSLVNVATLSGQAQVRPGRLEGWVREWRIRGAHPDTGGVCSLTVSPSVGTVIRGVAVVEPKEGLAALRRREWKYEQVQGVGKDFRCDDAARPGPEDMFLFRARSEFHEWGDEDHPILQSYLDCVLAGFHAFWGEAGVRHFIETTHGWHVPILPDRDTPRYPRAIGLSADVRDLIDTLLLEQNVRYLAAID